MARDDFPAQVKRQLALRVNYRCSNPECRAITSGPQSDPGASINLGVAAHISAASEGGPRFDAAISSEQRTSIANGIWLCQNCAKLIDSDKERFPADLLRAWRQGAEAETLDQIGKPLPGQGDSLDRDSRFGQLHRQSNPRFGFSFLHPTYWDREDPANGDGNTYRHPADPLVEVRAWGGYAVVSEDLCAWVEWTLDCEAKEKGYNLLSRVPSGRHLVDWVKESGEIVECREEVEGVRIVYETEADGHRITAMQTFVQYGDTRIGLRCQAPTDRYRLYEQLFLSISHELRILGPHAAPFARTGVLTGGSLIQSLRSLMQRLISKAKLVL
jgi:hypothetical protein